ncbi:MAG: hypothetical protein LBH24_06885 [Clostridiales bacterium]|jgi:hypothetical protein|nr:hypothetical protein [Clostridiales bacterium]
MRKWIKTVASALCLCLAFAAFAACGGQAAGEISGDAEYFLSLVEALETDGVTPDSFEDLDDAQFYYDALPDSDKQQQTVTEAKAKLDAFFAEYELLVTAKDFLTKAKAVPAAAQITVGDLGKLTAAETAYASLAEAAKQLRTVREAHERVAAAKTAYSALVQAETNASAFIAAVNAISVDLACQPAIEAAYALYDALTEAERAMPGISGAKAALDDKKSQYQNIEAFIEAANALDGETIYESEHLNNLLELYNTLPAAVRSDGAVSAAKGRLDDALLRAEEVNAPLDAAAFIALTVGLPTDFARIQLADLDAIETAEAAYARLSNAAKAFSGVSEANGAVIAAREFYTDLKAATDFIALAALLPDTITAADGGRITAAETAYAALTDRAKTVDGVGEANDRVVAARLQYGQIATERLPAFFGLELHPETISDGGFVWGDPNGQLAAYKGLYGDAAMSNAALLEKVDFAVYFYPSGAREGDEAVYRYVLRDVDPELHILLRSRIREILTAAGVPNGNYKMTLIGEDKTGKFLDAPFPGFSSPNYNFTA